MRKELIDSNLLTHLSRFYSARCTIRYYTVDNLDSFGQPQPVWLDFPAHVDLPCAIAPSGGREAKRPDMTVVTSTHIIAMAGYHPTIKPKMRAVIAGQEYDILSVEVDSRSKTTRLMAEVVT